jgi:hypothetical protein
LIVPAGFAQLASVSTIRWLIRASPLGRTRPDVDPLADPDATSRPELSIENKLPTASIHPSYNVDPAPTAPTLDVL